MFVGEVLGHKTENTCMVKVSSGNRNVVGIQPKLSREELPIGTRVPFFCTASGNQEI